MNTKRLALGGLATILALGATFGVSAQTPTPAAPGGARRMGGRAGRERHPEMMAALKALRNARERLNRSAHDFDGHRVKAVEHTEAAIHEVELALASDKH